METIDKASLDEAIDAVVGGVVHSQAPKAMLDIYHAIVESLIHPYNAEALDAVREAVGVARAARAEGNLAKGEMISQLVLDAEAAMSHLGVEPIAVNPEKRAEAKAFVTKMREAAKDFLLSNIPEDAFEPNEARPN